MAVRYGASFTAVAILAACGLSACGSTRVTETVTVTTTGPSTPAATPSAPAPRAKMRRKARPVSAMRACDANIVVKRGTTSCAFGENVFYGFWKAQDQGDDAFSAYSPVTERSYAMSCTSGKTVVCRAGDGGEVRFPLAAIRAYTAEDAARYAAAHDTGPDPAASEDGSGAGAGSGSEDNCDANYERQCLDPDSPDYDCEGGSGDGPDYTGPVTVVGDDHFGLDRDGDGQACE